MQLLVIILTGIFGLIIGSFLNVVILRMNTGKGIGGRSMCFSCRKTLSWYELIPVVSFLVQGGKCRSCRSRISWQYPIVELATAILFAGVAAAFDPVLHPSWFAFWLAFTAVSVMVSAYDLRHRIIPFAGLACLAVLSVVGGVASGHYFIVSRIVGATVVPFPFFILWLVSKGKWIGFGDVELMACVGFLFGIVSGYSAVILSFWTACLVVIPVFVFFKVKGREVSHEIPFGPFLLFGIYLVGVCGLDLLTLITNMVH